ncbi:cation-transporting P-type ATPase [Rhodoferax sp.]|uniref:cation-transporting P-type ATPase n=1 Tax=Rhodoferax sp. TaxID=50421 RepID=UPI00341CA770
MTPARHPAAERLDRVGPNRLTPARQRAMALQFLLHFKNLLGCLWHSFWSWF